MATTTLTFSYEIHDSWTELLAGTRYLLDLMGKKNLSKIPRANLVRLTVISAYQMTEVMFFHQLDKKVKSRGSDLSKAFGYDLREKISFSKARKKWPNIVMGEPLPLNVEPFQSMERLGVLRNSAIHHTAQCPDIDIGESALFTAIDTSKSIYNFFNDDCWNESEYSLFSERYKSNSTELIASLTNKLG